MKYLGSKFFIPHIALEVFRLDNIFTDCVSTEDYLHNYVEENTNINIWYDYLQPAHSDIHEILMDIIRDTRRINSLESPR